MGKGEEGGDGARTVGDLGWEEEVVADGGDEVVGVAGPGVVHAVGEAAGGVPQEPDLLADLDPGEGRTAYNNGAAQGQAMGPGIADEDLGCGLGRAGFDISEHVLLTVN